MTAAQALLDSWLGSADLQPGPLAVMTLIAVVAGGAAVRLFRWE